MFASSRLTLAALAKGEIIARAARRTANGGIDLSTARGMKAGMLPGSLHWSQLPEPVLVQDLVAYGEAVKKRPPRLLRPLHVGEDVHVLAIGKVQDVAYDAARNPSWRRCKTSPATRAPCA